MKQTMSFMVVMLAATHFVTYGAVFVAIGGYTFTQTAAIGDSPQVTQFPRQISYEVLLTQ